MKRLGCALALATAMLLGACSDDAGVDATAITFGPSPTTPPARTIPPEAKDFCGMDAQLLAVGDLLSQLEEPLQMLANGDLAGAKQPMAELYDALDKGTGVLNGISSTAPTAIKSDVQTVIGAILASFAKIPPRADMLAALDSGNGAAVTTLLGQFEEAITSLGTTSPEVDEAGARMREYVAANC